MSPDTLASLLEADPYPGCVVTRSGGIARLDFDGLTLRYHADGWHFGEQILESTLSEYSAPEHVEDEIYRVLKVAFGLKVQHALSEAEADRTIDPVEYLIDLCAEKMRQRLSHASITRECKEEIGRLSAERDTLKAHTTIAEARISGLESEIEATHKVFDGVGVTWSTGLESGRLPLVKRAALAVEPGVLADAERKVLEGRIKALEGALDPAKALIIRQGKALTRICETVGVSVDVPPDTIATAVKTLLGASEHAEARVRETEATMREIAQALDDAGAPQAYHLEDGAERPIPDPERIRLLGERVHTLRAQVREVTDATNYLDALIEAHNALDTRNAPRLADGCVLSLAARIRSLPR